MSKDAYYIKHDCNSRRDIKIMAMLAEWGMAGYGMYWTLVEIMREQAEYKLQKSKFLYKVLAKDMMCQEVDSERFVKNCIEDFELLEEDETYIYSPSLIRRMQKLDDIRASRSAAGKKGGRGNKKKVVEDDPFPLEVKPEKKDDVVDTFLEMFNRIKKHYKPMNFKPTETLTRNAKKNLKIIIKKYDLNQMENATKEMFNNKWAKDTGNQTPTHLLVESNFERYLERAAQNTTTQTQISKPIKYG